MEYSKKPCSKNSCHAENSQLISNKNQAASFFMIRIFTERYFWAGFRKVLLAKILLTLLSKFERNFIVRNYCTFPTLQLPVKARQ